MVSGVDACCSLVSLSEKIFMTRRNPAVCWLNHGGKMNQKFSTSLHQSFDVHRISDRRGKSGHRAWWASSSCDANTQIEFLEIVQAQGESLPNHLAAMSSVAVKYWGRVAYSLLFNKLRLTCLNKWRGVDTGLLFYVNRRPSPKFPPHSRK